VNTGIQAMVSNIRIPILHRYIMRNFLFSLLGTLSAFTVLFLMFDFFEKVKVFVKEDASFFQALTYLFLKTPLIIHLMFPLSILLATLFSIGKLSQSSEITAMRACGISLFWIAKPILILGIFFSGISFLIAETVVPWSTRLVDELYQIDIKKKAEKGSFSRQNYWYRNENRFFNIGLYDSRNTSLANVTELTLTPDFRFQSRIDAPKVLWQSPTAGWIMEQPVEIRDIGQVKMHQFDMLPFVVREHPKNFYDMQISPESMSYLELNTYAQKLESEGVPATKYRVDLMSKLSFPFINLLVILLAFPLSIVSARTRTLTKSFIVGISLSFAFYITHAFCTSLGSAEILPILPAAWSALLLFVSIGGFLMAGMEKQ